jgi:probable H4MPT-linked C1 transfer pathway protein
MSDVLGLDVGGANLKAATAGGFAVTRPFELWKHPSRLPNALRELLDGSPPCDRLAVTITGELCDCYTRKWDGVEAILYAVESAAAGKPVSVWRTDGRFTGVKEAKADHLLTAAANWLALATFAGRFAPNETTILIDIGSTTADVIPLSEGRPVPVGRTDTERLRTGELVYTGARRTPVCALLGPEGVAELFATMLDVYLLLGRIGEDESDHDTADGRSATKPFAHVRLARMIGGDDETVSLPEAVRLAERLAMRQSELLQAAIRTVIGRLPRRPRTVILSGSGEFLARSAVGWLPELDDVEIVSLSERLGEEVASAACAYAVAVLCGEGATDG